MRFSQDAKTALEKRAAVFALKLLSAMAGCATHTPQPPGESSNFEQYKTEKSATTVNHKPSYSLNTDEKDIQSPLRITRKTGSGQFLNTTKTSPPEFIDTDPEALDKFNVNMIEVPIEQAADALLRDTLGLSYLVTPGTTGTVTIRTAWPLSRAALFDAFQSALEMNGFSVQRENDTYIVSGQDDSMKRFLVGAQSADAVNGVHVVPLEFIAAAEMLKILQPIATNALEISPNIDRNILLISGSRENVRAALDAVELFDVNVMQGKSVSRVELTSANPTAVAAELSVIFGAGPGGALYGVIEFIPNNVLGSILIISSSPQYARDAEVWIQGYENSIRTEIYELRNRSASDLAGVLTALVARESMNGETAPSTPTTADGPLTPGAAAASSQGPGVTIVADETANAIIVHATSSKQKEVSTLIKRLDDIADQVLIEAMIAEVQLNDSLNFGVRHFFESGNFTTSFSGLVSGGTSALFPGANALFNDGGTLTAAIDALSSITKVNIVSAPSLLVLDNREAFLNIGDQVPVVTQTSSSITDPNAPIVNAVEYRDTGVILRVKPRVDNSGRVILDISQEVSDAVTTDTSEIDAPTIQQRTISTTVAMDDGQSLMLGGLIRQNDTNTRAKVPVIGDVPLLGTPFRRTETTNRRTELLVIITPRVVRNSSQVRSITEEYKRKLFAPNTLMQQQHHSASSTLKRILE
ncbi:MAG: type II secretion system secretin GspD [Pseudomonadota bacterium]